MNWLSKTERYARIKGVYEEMEDIINNFYKSPNTIDTPFPMNLLAKEKYKDILVGTSWSGFLLMSDKKQTSVFENYINGG